MRTDIPEQILVATPSGEATSTAIESPFERASVVPRADEVIVSDTVRDTLEAAAASDRRPHGSGPHGHATSDSRGQDTGSTPRS